MTWPMPADRIAGDEAERRHNSITDRWSKTTRMTSVEVDQHDNLKATKEAFEIVTARYER